MTKELVSESPRNCYIYGSVHVQKPPEELLEYADKLVDYVIIEGVHTKVNLDLKFIAYWLPTYVGFKLIFMIEKCLSRLKGHRGDMEEIIAFFERRGKKVERVDRDIRSVIEHCFQRVKKWQPLLSLFLMACGYGVIQSLIGLLQASWSLNALSFFISFLSVMLAIIFVPISLVRSSDCLRYRDELVVKRVAELIKDHSVLIARGKTHVNILRKELEKQGIKCRELEVKKAMAEEK